MTSHLSPTNIANYYHNQCHLYLWNVYHRPKGVGKGRKNEPSPLAAAQFSTGLVWEERLFMRLEVMDQLVRLESAEPKTVTEIRDIISNATERVGQIKYISNLAFKSPLFTEELKEFGSPPRSVAFGVAKPDLVKVTRTESSIVWEIIDAKSSSALKSSHNAQIGFYHLCLENLLASAGSASIPLVPSAYVSIWMPEGGDVGEGEETPDANDYEESKPVSTPTSLLLPPLKTFLFKTLPQILGLPRNEVDWYLNPACHGCEFFESCKSTTIEEKRLGMLPNLSLSDTRFIHEVFGMANDMGLLETPRTLTDIEELNLLVKPPRVDQLEKTYPATAKRFQRLLGVQTRHGQRLSPLLDAAISQKPQLTKQRVFSFPRSEDMGIYISVINDIANGSLGAFCISVRMPGSAQHLTGPATDFVKRMGNVLYTIRNDRRNYRVQVYTYSPVERTAIVNHLIEQALKLEENEEMIPSIRLCLGALCEGASVLATSFQPTILSGVLLSFLSKRHALTLPVLQACCKRLRLSDNGPIEDLRKRLEARQLDLAGKGGRTGLENREVGQLGKIVVLKKEIERLMSLPIPGFVDLPQTADILLGDDKEICPSDDAIFGAWNNRATDEKEWQEGLKNRNRCMRAIVDNLRKRIADAGLLDKILLNEARVLGVGMMDICKSRQLRKLLFMQQFEVVLRLQELWQSRLDGCPNAPLLRYVGAEKNGTAWHSIFDIVSGSIEPPVQDREFYDWLIVEDTSDSDAVPPEIYFDDLSVSGLFFPLTRYTHPKWDEQHKRVKDEVFIANINDLRMVTEGADRKPRTQALMKTFYTGKQLQRGAIYRISPRLVDFNLNRVLLNLVTMDFQETVLDERVPFMEIIKNPSKFAGSSSFCGKDDERKARKNVDELTELATRLEAAKPLVLMNSQQRAARRLMMSRLSVVWGPPGTGKTHTLALSTLQMLEVLGARAVDLCPYILVTAMTHAAIEAIVGKINKLMDCYRKLGDRDSSWLDNIELERVYTGSTHLAPTKRKVYIYAGTTFQLYKFCDKVKLRANLIIIDEAGQLALGTAALAIRWLSNTGKLVLGGDHKQLAPIFGMVYKESEVEPTPLFGSVLDMLMGGKTMKLRLARTLSDGGASQENYDHQVVQLLENFRLNGDIGDFIATIYTKKFDHQKKTVPIAEDLHLWLDAADPSSDPIMEQARLFLIGMSNVMRHKKSSTFDLTPPQLRHTQDTISLALLRVRTPRAGMAPYEAHVKAEARLAAALVHWLRESFPEESIFVACPHRIQRSAVRQAIMSPQEAAVVDEVDELTAQLEAFHVSEQGLRIDTVERLQGSEASFVIFLLSHTHVPSLGNHRDFLLARRRLNVGISRAKSLCILISSSGVLRPSLEVLANPETREGLEFLRDYEDHAWKGDMDLEL